MSISISVLKATFELTNAPFAIYTGKRLVSALISGATEHDFQPESQYIVDRRDGLVIGRFDDSTVHVFNDEARNRWQEFQHRLGTE